MITVRTPSRIVNASLVLSALGLALSMSACATAPPVDTGAAFVDSDLVESAFTTAPTPATAFVPFTVTTTIKNTGKIDCGPFTAQLFLTVGGGTPGLVGAGSFTSCPGGGTVSFISVPLLGSGTGVFNVYIDPTNAVKETNESNNNSSHTLTLASPDLSAAQ